MAEKKKTYRIVEVELLKDHTHARVLRKKAKRSTSPRTSQNSWDSAA